MTEGVGRYVKFTAQPGRGDDLANLLLEVAGSLRDTPGCELYVINRSAQDPNEIWVTELWLDQDSIDASLQALDSDAGRAQTAHLMSLLAKPPERIDLAPLGGVGYLPGGTGHVHVNLEDVEDMAPRFGFAHLGEARFATKSLGATRTGLSHQRLRPNARQAFGHRHRHAEEVVVILAGNGHVKIDSDIEPVRPLDAIRFAPNTSRGFEAGPQGVEFLVFGPHHTGDAVLDPNFWPPEVA